MNDENNLNSINNGVSTSNDVNSFKNPLDINAVQTPVQSVAPVEMQSPVVNDPFQTIAMQNPAANDVAQNIQTPVVDTPTLNVEAPIQSDVTQNVQAPVSNDVVNENIEPTVTPVQNQVIQDFASQNINPVQSEVVIENTIQEPVQSVELSSEPIAQSEANTTVETIGLQNNVIEQAPQVNESSFTSSLDSVPQKKKSSKGLLIVLLLVVVLGGLFAFWNFVLLNKTNVVKTSISMVYDYATSNIDKIQKNTLTIDPAVDVFGFNGSVKFSSDYKNSSIDLTNLSKYEFKYESAFDLANKNFYLSSNINKDSKSLLDLNLFIKDNIASFLSEKLSYYSYQYDLSDTSGLYSYRAKAISEYDFKKTINFQDIKTLVNKAKNVSLNNVDESKVKRELSSKKVGNEEKKLMKISYTFDISNEYKSIANSFMNDEEALEILSRLFSKEKDEVKDLLADYANNIEDQTFMILDIYVDAITGKFTSLSLANRDDGGVFNIDKINEDYKFNFIDDGGNEEFTGEYISASKTLKFNIIDGSSLFNISFKEISETKMNFNFKYTSSSEYSGESSIEFNADIENVLTSNKQDLTISAQLSYTSGNNNVTLGFDWVNTLEKGLEVKKDTNMFVKNIYEIDELEMYELRSKLQVITQEIMSDFYKGSSYYLEDLPL